MLKNKFYCNPTYEVATDKTFYVKLSTGTKSKIKFTQFKNTLDLTFNFYFLGAYQLPENLLLMNIDSNVGQFKNIKLKIIQESKTKKYYEANLLINLDASDKLSKEQFLEELYFKASFDINESVLNNSVVNGDFNSFYKDLKTINFQENIYFSNYFPINKLSEYYISQNYKNNFASLDKLPNDLYSWSKSTMTIYPEYWFIQSQDYKNLDHNSNIDKIYYSNVTDSSFIKNFSNVEIKLVYYIKENRKELNIDLESNPNFSINQNKTLFLGVKTIYNFEKEELVQSSSGVEGIYFPVQTYGQLNIKLQKNNIVYKDKIDFSFKNDFYSNQNTNLDIELSTFTSTSGQWTEIIYA